MRTTFGTLLGMMAAVGAVVATARQTPTASVAVTGAWVREAAAGQAATAAYFVIENRGSAPVTIVSVTSPVAASAELHTMTMTKSEGPTPVAGMPMGQMMTMTPVDRVVVPAKGRVEFKPGGLHVMLFKVSKTLAVGDTADVTLQFADGTRTSIRAAVVPRAAVAAPAGTPVAH